MDNLRQTGRLLLPLVLLALCESPVHADIDYYRLFRSLKYEQTDDGPPQDSPTGFFGAVDIISSEPGDLASAEVVVDSPLSPMTLNPAPGGFSFGQSFSTLEELDINFPLGTTYSYFIDGGTLGMQMATLTSPETDLFAAEIPYFTNNAFSALQGIHPDSAFTFAWNGYTPDPLVNSAPVFFSLVRLSDGHQVLGTSTNNMPGSIDLPAGSLEPLTNYRASLFYSSRMAVENAGFEGATSEIGFDLLTELYFTTGPGDSEILLGDYNRNGMVDAADYVVWRDTLGQNVTEGSGADGDLDGEITPADYDVWKTHFGDDATPAATAALAAPEPAMTLIILCGLNMAAMARCWRRPKN